MPKTVVPLTATQIKNAKPREKIYKLSDGGGLYLRVLPSGKKSWELRVTVNSKRKALYRDAEGMTLAQARGWRDEASCARERLCKSVRRVARAMAG